MAPELLILDEPTAGLDPAGEALLLDILADLEATLLLVSHDMFFVGELTRRTLVMHQGRIAWDLPTREFMRDEALGSLNGLAFIYRRDCGDAIRALQHEHEHCHPHRHPGGDAAHEHPPERHHEHDHPGHEAEPHDHEHE
jgi:energy-coupling factor transporter ATP-binding protein EcfA2